MVNWYIIKTKPSKENSVAKLISKAGFEVFYPKIETLAYREKLSFAKVNPLFPTYLFLKIDFTNPNLTHLVKYTRGVSKILSTNNKPQPIDPDVIRIIKNNTKNDGIVSSLSLTEPKPGNRIRVKKGLLKDLEGVFEKKLSANERVVVLLNLLNYQMKTCLHWSEIEILK